MADSIYIKQEQMLNILKLQDLRVNKKNLKLIYIPVKNLRWSVSKLMRKPRWIWEIIILEDPLCLEAFLVTLLASTLINRLFSYQYKTRQKNNFISEKQKQNCWCFQYVSMQGTLPVSAQGTPDTLPREHLSTQGTLAPEHVSTQDTLARENEITQGTLVLEHVRSQDILAREHIGTQGTLARQHVRHVSTQWARF